MAPLRPDTKDEMEHGGATRVHQGADSRARDKSSGNKTRLGGTPPRGTVTSGGGGTPWAHGIFNASALPPLQCQEQPLGAGVLLGRPGSSGKDPGQQSVVTVGLSEGRQDGISFGRSGRADGHRKEEVDAEEEEAAVTVAGRAGAWLRGRTDPALRGRSRGCHCCTEQLSGEGRLRTRSALGSGFSGRGRGEEGVGRAVGRGQEASARHWG